MVTPIVASLLLSQVKPSVLIFSKTAGFRHDSIPVAVAALGSICEKRGWKYFATEDASVFAKKSLGRFNVVVFALTTGDILNKDQELAFESWLKQRHGFVGFHAASDTEYDWPFYASVIGAYFKSHPPGGYKAMINITDAKTPMTAHAKSSERYDEWYDWKATPRGKVRVLATIDEATYKKDLPQDHPIMWCQDKANYRMFYSAMGHFKEVWSQTLHLAEAEAAILWSAQANAKPEYWKDL
jgi:type 1 glutamine amidotransferase